MNEAEKRTFFALASDRGPGKRQIKPNANVLFDSLPLTDSDEDDDFVVPGNDDDEISDSNSSSSGSDADNNDDDSESSDTSNQAELDSDNQGHTIEEVKPNDGVSSSNHNIQPDQLICTLCLNQRAVVRNDEVIQCDKCGVAVHENCYITENPGDADSDGSSSTTEPWFCEPCLYDQKEPPYCELCPNRFGAFKKSDIGGGWVHLLCALYTPGMTFGDVDRLSAVSWQEIDYKLFGKRACVACSDPLQARTGIAVPCDAALCKSHLHVTCAQRLGLLIDNTERSADPNFSNSSNSNSLPAHEAETVDPLYLTCKRHANENLMKQRKAICEQLYKQEEARMLRMRRRVLSEREERKRLQMLERHKKGLKNLEGITIAWPEHDNKRPRLLHTSSKFLELFIEKAEGSGISRQKFLENFIKIDGAQIPYLPPGFSNEFIQYFNHRDKITIPEETKKLEALRKETEYLRIEQKKLQDLLHTDPAIALNNDPNVLQEWYETLYALGLRKLKKPAAPVENKTIKNSSKKSQSLEAVANPSTSNFASAKKVLVEKKTTPVSAVKTAEVAELKINCCDTCKKVTEQHLMTQCDTCHNYYHLACLEPPLLKMPKKTSNQGWLCSNCGNVSSESDSENKKAVNGPRKLRDRSMASVRRKEEEKAERKAFRAAIRSTKKRSVYRKKTNKNSDPNISLSMDDSEMIGLNGSNYSAPPAISTGKRRNSERPKKNKITDHNGIHLPNNTEMLNKALSTSPVSKRKRDSSVNSLSPSLPKIKPNETAH